MKLHIVFNDPSQHAEAAAAAVAEAAAAAAAAADATAGAEVKQTVRHEYFESATMIEDFIEILHHMFHIAPHHISFTVNGDPSQQYTLTRHKYKWLDQIGVVEDSLITVTSMCPVQQNSGRIRSHEVRSKPQ